MCWEGMRTGEEISKWKSSIHNLPFLMNVLKCTGEKQHEKQKTVVFSLVGNARTLQYSPIVIKPSPKIPWKIMSWTLWGSSESLMSQLTNTTIPVVPGLEVPIRHSTHCFGHNIYYHPNKISFKINGRKSVSTHQSVDKPFLISKFLEAHELYKSQPGISNLLCAAFSLFSCSFHCQTGHSQ